MKKLNIFQNDKEIKEVLYSIYLKKLCGSLRRMNLSKKEKYKFVKTTNFYKLVMKKRYLKINLILRKILIKLQLV